jgi:4-hydroxy-3-methylbut-2-enyl diphosphate reductase
MIHNPQVNADLESKGVRFLQDTKGKQIIPFESLRPNDIVLIPAFGTTLEIEEKLNRAGIQTEQYNTTCPFVEKVWNRSAAIAGKKYTIIIHGKPTHEETRATFSHASKNAHAVVVRDMDQAIALGKYIKGEKSPEEFYKEFQNQYSENFNVPEDLQRIGVVNQTTMLASDTQAIADYLKQVMTEKYPVEPVEEHFADTRDTLCYATLDNQTAVSAMLGTPADIAIVAGGYNSSNTSHLVELCEIKLPTFFINNEEKILSEKEILHYDFHTKKEILTTGYLPANPRILLTSGASCPDAIVEAIIEKLVSFFPGSMNIDDVTKRFTT